MQTAVSIELYETLEDTIGKDKARVIVREIETGAQILALQKKIEIKDELLGELASKAELKSEIQSVRSEIKSVEGVLRAEMQTMKAELRSDIKTMGFKMVTLSSFIIAAVFVNNPKIFDAVCKLRPIAK